MREGSQKFALFFNAHANSFIALQQPATMAQYFSGCLPRQDVDCIYWCSADQDFHHGDRSCLSTKLIDGQALLSVWLFAFMKESCEAVDKIC